MKKFKGVMGKANELSVKVYVNAKNCVNNERGAADVLVYLIFVCLLILAALGMKTSIGTAFSGLATWFSTTVMDKVKTAI